MPGRPKTTVTAAVNYHRVRVSVYGLSLFVNGSYHSRVDLAFTSA